MKQATNLFNGLTIQYRDKEISMYVRQGASLRARRSGNRFEPAARTE